MKKTSLSKIQQKSYFKTLCQMTTNILELEEGSLSSKSRKKYLQVPRMVVSVVARIVDDTHFDVIAEGINRDRTLIKGVNHSEKPQTTIRIKSGKVGVDIKVSFRDFSNTLELINLALTDCNYKLIIL